MSQQIATEHHVERRVRKRSLGRIALLKPPAWRVPRPRLRVLHESSVELDADALTWFEHVGETAGGYCLVRTRGALGFARKLQRIVKIRVMPRMRLPSPGRHSLGFELK
jgi:hypothetical protein